VLVSFQCDIFFQSTVQNPTTFHPCALLGALTHHHQEHTHFIQTRVCSSWISFPAPVH